MSQPYSPVAAIPDRYDSTAYEKEKVVKTTASLFLSATMFNAGAATLYLMVMDAATNAGAFPAANRGGIVEVPVNTARSLDWSNTPVAMTTGIYIAASTSPTSKVLPGTNDVIFSVAFRSK